MDFDSMELLPDTLLSKLIIRGGYVDRVLDSALTRLKENVLSAQNTEDLIKAKTQYDGAVFYSVIVKTSIAEMAKDNEQRDNTHYDS